MKSVGDMRISKVFGLLSDWLSVRTDSPELRMAQFAALARLIPLMYFILVVNAWVLAILFYDMAPITLTVYTTGALTAICVLRLLFWWRQSTKPPSPLSADIAARELRRTNLIAAILAIGFPLWAFALFPYGGESEQAHVAFFLTITMLGSMLCLIHVRSAALIIAVVGGIPIVVFLAMTGKPGLIALVINAGLVVAAAVKIIFIQSRDFAHMVNARTEAQRRESEQSRLLRMIDDMPVAVMTVDPQTFNIDYVNETSRRTLGRIEHLLPITVAELQGCSIDVFHKHPEHQRRILSDPSNLPHHARVRLGPETLDLQVSAITDDDGSYMGPMLSWTIVTKEVETENHVRQLALYDSLTGLPNRATFRKQLDSALEPADAGLALMFVDLDGFKMVNDTRGHRIGDVLLRQVAGRLREECEATDMVVGRLGGDEFAVLLPRGDRETAERLAIRLVEAIGAPYRLDADHSVQIGASIGIAVAPEHGSHSEALLSRADIALYAAKSAGKGGARTFSADMEAQVRERVQMEVRLRRALETEEGLFVFYQPIVDIGTGATTAREALVRWHHLQRGWISPAEFIPVAEDSGLIDRLTTFVFNRACREAARWQDAASVAVNISPVQLGTGLLVPTVSHALAQSGLPAARLEIEVTETALMHREAGGLEELRQLRALGVRVALDDFGTGYSSLAHLRVFSFDKIKIDGSFVRDCVDRPDCAAVVGAVVELGARLGMKTVAEGVETEVQLERIKREGCNEVQGYLVGRPAPSDEDAAKVQELNLLTPVATASVAATMTHFTRSAWVGIEGEPELAAPLQAP